MKLLEIFFWFFQNYLNDNHISSHFVQRKIFIMVSSLLPLQRDATAKYVRTYEIKFHAPGLK